MSASRKHAQGGYCTQDEPFNSNYLSRFCALDSTQCPLDPPLWNFKSAKEHIASARPYWECYSRSTTESIQISSCGTDKCAADRESCNGDNVFTPLVTNASVDPKCVITNAMFGNCNGRCVWSANDCSVFETYTLPPTPSLTSNYNPQPDDCTCDKVQIGGCLNEGSPVICSVSETACEYTQKWYTHDDLLAKEGVACYLCRPPPTQQPVPSPVQAPTTTMTDNDDAKPTNMSNDENTVGMNEKSSNNNDGGGDGGDPNIGAIVGGTVGAIVAITMVVAFILVRSKRKKAAEPSPTDVFTD